MIAIQTSFIALILIVLAVYIALGLAVKKTFCISHFWFWIKFPDATYTANVIKFKSLEDKFLESLIIIIQWYIIHVREFWKEFKKTE